MEIRFFKLSLSWGLIIANEALSPRTEGLQSKMADASHHPRPASTSSQARHRHASDPGEGSSAKQPRKGKVPAKGSSATAAPKQSKEELRHHKALEKAVLRAQQWPSAILPVQAAILSPSDSATAPQISEAHPGRELFPDRPSSRGPTSSEAEQVFQTIPDSSDPPGPSHSVASVPGPSGLVASPAATHTLPAGTSQADPQATLEAIIARAIQQGLAQGLQQGLFQPPPPPPVSHAQPRQAQSALSADHQYSPEPSNQGSLSDEEESRELSLSDDEGLTLDQPAFIGLFRPQLFRSLLYKALAVTRLGSSSTAGTTLPEGADPASSLFAEPAVEPELIPAPKLFTDVVQRQWALPGSVPVPSGTDK
ncbi:uncharacterized protein LOC132710243 [Pantherophis guttatus]|uniref:Uncharacterized protein LOC132710243 n=1 Tax=Pantherophis guttatus TaxID=94885 RepID=A0ABM3Z0N3_PANGU|nr:uncharacterized protein LOC132710243 [Pantherophis guttatus]